VITVTRHERLAKDTMVIEADLEKMAPTIPSNHGAKYPLTSRVKYGLGYELLFIVYLSDSALLSLSDIVNCAIRGCESPFMFYTSSFSA
jgi:hypothetical protein